MSTDTLLSIIADIKKHGAGAAMHSDVTAVLQAIADGDLVHVDQKQEAAQ